MSGSDLLFLWATQTDRTGIQAVISLWSLIVWWKLLYTQKQEIKILKEAEYIRQLEAFCNVWNKESYCKGVCKRFFTNTDWDNTIIQEWTICDILITQAPDNWSWKCTINNSNRSIRWDSIKRKIVNDYVLKYFDIYF